MDTTALSRQTRARCIQYLMSLPSDPSDLEILKAEESLTELLASFVALNIELPAISQGLMDDGLVPVLDKLIRASILSCSKLGGRFEDEFIPNDWTLAMVAELQSMHPAVRLSAAKACVAILPIASFNDHLTACFDIVLDAFCAETDPPILLELMKVVESDIVVDQFYAKLLRALTILAPFLMSSFRCNLDLFARSGMIELLRSIFEIIDQFKTMNILDVLSRLLVEYPDDTPMCHDVLKLGYHMASDMDYPPLPSAFREAIGKLVESIADENLTIAREAIHVVHLILTTSKSERRMDHIA
ncbi:hypothetical protein BASA83_006511 [Batrachochytrium salamandrivorans]|nr:hypothetical protein BASA83_006511 [Batrachochytrium salamandrivorans]